MGIFGINYNRPGPGVDINAPKKRGVSRFIELLTREFADLVKLNLLLCAFALPSAALFFTGLFGVGGWLSGRVAFALSVLAALPVGGALTAGFFCLTRMLRDDPDYLLHGFIRKFRENAAQAALPGMLYTSFAYTQIYLWISMISGTKPPGYGTLALLIVTGAFIEMTAPYLFLQIAHLSLKTTPILINSILMSIKDAPKSLCGMIMGRLFLIATVLYFPLSVWWSPFILLLGFSLSWLINLMWIWPGVDKVFSISETLKARREETLKETEAVFTRS